MKLYNEFRDRQGEFEILAFHGPSAESVSDLRQKTESLVRDVWKRSLPFPVLLDSTGETVSRFGIRSWPTTVVIGPDGKVVRHGGEHTVREYLLETDREVKSILKALRKARSKRSLDKALSKIVKLGGEKSVYALKHFAENDAKKKYVPRIFKALNEVGGEYAIFFFLGKCGLGAEDKEVRLAAVEALKKHCRNEHLGYLIPKINQEEDEDVRKALVEAAQVAQERR
jgi:hypothetical protein